MRQRSAPRRSKPTPEQLKTEQRRKFQGLGIPLTPGIPGRKYTDPRRRAMATTSPTVLQRFGPDDPTIAVLDKANVLVWDLDLDPEAGIDGVKEYFRLCKKHRVRVSDTLTISTPRGGVHLYFLQPPGERIGCSVGRVGRGIDIRGRGGLAVLPPTPGYSILVDAPIRPLPPKLGLLLEATPRRTTPTAPGGTTKHKLGGILSKLNNAVEGERNHTLHWALCKVAEMPPGRHRSALWNIRNVAHGIGLPDYEIERTINSVFGDNRG